jgi:hypothetical protein
MATVATPIPIIAAPGSFRTDANTLSNAALATPNFIKSLPISSTKLPNAPAN